MRGAVAGKVVQLDVIGMIVSRTVVVRDPERCVAKMRLVLIVAVLVVVGLGCGDTMVIGPAAVEAVVGADDAGKGVVGCQWNLGFG